MVANTAIDLKLLLGTGCLPMTNTAGTCVQLRTQQEPVSNRPWHRFVSCFTHILNIWAEVLLQAPKWPLNSLDFNSPWTHSNYFLSTLTACGSSDKAQQKALAARCQAPFDPTSSDSQELHLGTSYISGDAIDEADTNDPAFHPCRGTMGHQNTHRAHSGGHFRTFQTSKQQLPAKVACSTVCTLPKKLHYWAQWQPRETWSLFQSWKANLISLKLCWTLLNLQHSITLCGHV